MPGGVEGIEPQDGKLSFSGSINLTDFKQNLLDYLASYERGIGQEFPVKPLELKKLYLIALVQNDETKEILQSASIPVAGKTDSPPKEDP